MWFFYRTLALSSHARDIRPSLFVQYQSCSSRGWTLLGLTSYWHEANRLTKSVQTELLHYWQHLTKLKLSLWKKGFKTNGWFTTIGRKGAVYRPQRFWPLWSSIFKCNLNINLSWELHFFYLHVIVSANCFLLHCRDKFSSSSILRQLPPIKIQAQAATIIVLVY